jgi:hypothetical protein
MHTEVNALTSKLKLEKMREETGKTYKEKQIMMRGARG